MGLAMGATFALLRSTYSKLLPDKTEDTTSYFSFYDVSEKVGLIFGLIIFGLIEDITHNIRYSLLSMVVFFIIGFFLLMRVKVNLKD